MELANWVLDPTYMYECRCDDDPRAEIFRYEESPLRYADPSMSACVHWESGSCSLVSSDKVA